MSKTLRIAAALLVGLPLTAPAALLGLPMTAAAQEAGGDVPVKEDLLAVLTLRGKHCDRPAKYERIEAADYRVRCADGHRYRIYVDDERVIVEELEPAAGTGPGGP